MTETGGGGRLRVIEGGQRESFRLGRGVVRLWSGVGLPPGASALVCEEDTMQVLGADLELKLVRDHPVRVLTAAEEARPVEPGVVLCSGRAPVVLRAVIHDLDREPSWQVDWIRSALEQALRQAAQQTIEGLAMPLLGTIHGRLPLPLALELTFQVLVAARETLPGRIWLMVPASAQRDTRAQLDDLLSGLDDGA
jgi:hypothetical protein